MTNKCSLRMGKQPPLWTGPPRTEMQRLGRRAGCVNRRPWPPAQWTAGEQTGLQKCDIPHLLITQCIATKWQTMSTGSQRNSKLPADNSDSRGAPIDPNNNPESQNLVILLASCGWRAAFDRIMKPCGNTCRIRRYYKTGRSNRTCLSRNSGYA